MMISPKIKNKTIANFIHSLQIFSLLVIAIMHGQVFAANAQTINPQKIPAAKQNNIRYACEAYINISGFKVKDNWCSCQNEYYRNLLTPADWDRYSQDIVSLYDFQNSNAQTPPNSYARKVKLGSSHCAACKEKNYAGCLKKPDTSKETVNMMRNLFIGNFKAVPRDARFSSLFTDYVVAYSDHCSHNIQSGIRFITTRSSKNGPTEQWEILVEDDFVAAYKKHRTIAKNRSVAESAATIGKTLKQDNPFDFTPIVTQGKTYAERARIVADNVKTNCNTSDGAILHENLRRFEAKLPPVHNATSKKLDAKVKDHAKKLAAAQEAERKRILIATKASYAKAKQRWAKRAAENELNKPLQCTSKGHNPSEGPVSADAQKDVEKYINLAGTWQGQLHGRQVEVFTWNRNGIRELQGLVFFPDLSCAMPLEFRPNKPKPMKPDFISVSVRSKRAMRSGFCAEKLGKHVNFDLNASFYFSPQSNAQSLVLVPRNTSKAYNPQSKLGFSA